MGFYTFLVQDFASLLERTTLSGRRPSAIKAQPFYLGLASANAATNPELLPFPLD
jgi:hypothetical protein